MNLAPFAVSAQMDWRLTFNDLDHYRHVLAALAETIRIQTQIDEAIPGWPIV